jgi:hypothetical protein
MSKMLSSPPCTPKKRPLAPYIAQICGGPATRLRSKRPKPTSTKHQYPCDQSGDDHKDNKLSFSKLVLLSSQLAQIFQHLPSDYYRTYTPFRSNLCRAVRLLQKDTTTHCHTISRRTACSAETDAVKRNTILRALVLFSLDGVHATQYLRHTTQERVAWITQLNISGVWIKSDWESDMAAGMIYSMQQAQVHITLICDPEYVYSMVFNTYFLMLFARRHCRELRTELDLMDAGRFSWHDLASLRKGYWAKRREKQTGRDRDSERDEGSIRRID